MLVIAKVRLLTLLFGLSVFLTLGGGCSQKPEPPLVVYAGKGLKNAMEDVKQRFEKKERIPVSIIYAGSNTLLDTLERSHKGDIFVPGSPSYLEKAKDLITARHFVALHIPVFTARADNALGLKAYADLLVPGVRIAVCNKDMAAMGRVAEAMLHNTGPGENFRHNIVITVSTVNELLQLVINGEVDAALVWTDMLTWNESAELMPITIPPGINLPKEIQVGVLSTSTSPARAKVFAEFMATEGRAIFTRHGFGTK